MRRDSARPVMAILLGAAMGLLGGCQESDPRPTSSTAAVREARTSGRIHRNDEHGFRLEVPASPWVVRWRSYRADSPARKLKGTLRLEFEGRAGVSLDVWTRADRQPVGAWFDSVLKGTVSHEATRTDALATRNRVATLRFAEPRSPQAPARLQAVFAQGSRVYRLVCLDAEEPRFRSAFERALQTFHQEATP